MPRNMVVIRVAIDQDALDELDVECEIAVIGRSLAVREGVAMWVQQQRTNPNHPPVVA